MEDQESDSGGVSLSASFLTAVKGVPRKLLSELQLSSSCKLMKTRLACSTHLRRHLKDSSPRLAQLGDSVTGFSCLCGRLINF